jgi:short-subunit dehydrogenase
MQFKNVIIFGATGDVGNSFVKYLLPKSQKLTLVVRSLTKIDSLVANTPNVRVIEFEFPKKISLLNDYLDQESTCYDLIINAIGVYGKTEDILNISHFENLINTNFNVLQHILCHLKPHINDNSKFVNISSIASHSGSATEIAYSSAKILVDNLMSSLRFDDSYKKVRTLNVRPGAIVSKMTNARANSSQFIDPDELAELCILTVCSGSSLTVPFLDVYRKV